MANIKTLFKCLSDTRCHLEIEQKGVSVIIMIKECGVRNFIELDISTAIKLHKTLRTEINKAKEVNND